MVFKWGLGCRYLQQLPVPIAGRLVGPHLIDPPRKGHLVILNHSNINKGVYSSRIKLGRPSSWA